MTFTWQPSQWLSDPYISNPIAKPPPGIWKYYLTATDTVIGAPCGETLDSVTITVIPAAEMAQADAGQDTATCAGDPVQIGTPDPSGGLWLYHWIPALGLDSDSVAMPWANPAIPVTYQLTIVHPTGATCAADTDSVNIGVEFPVSLNPFPDVEYCPWDHTQIGWGGLPGFQYSWTPTTGLSWPDQAVTRAEPKQSTDYVLQAENLSLQSPCRFAYDTVHVEVIPCDGPNVVTPNGDGFKDYLQFGGYEGPFSMAVFDRWGHQVYVSANYQHDWDCQGLKAGVYWYAIEPQHAADGERKTGVFTVLR